MFWAGRDHEDHPVLPPAMRHLALSQVSPSSVQPGLKSVYIEEIILYFNNTAMITGTRYS